MGESLGNEITPVDIISSLFAECRKDARLKRLEYSLIGLIVVAYLVIATLYAIKTPAWQVPDEPAHYNYIRQVAQRGCCPVIETGDWDNEYLDAIKAEKFRPDLLGRLETIQYEDHQPPLYYVLAAPIFSASKGDLTALRFFSVLIGAGVVILAWLVVRAVFPAQPYLALTTVAFHAFLPQHVAMMAGVENDGLAELLVGLILLVCVHYLQTSQDASESRRWWLFPSMLGILLGLTFITKLTAMLPMIPVVGVAVLLKARQSNWSVPSLVRNVAVIGVIALIFGIPLWLRNVSTYGGADILAQAAHDRVVVGQTRTEDYVAQVGVDKWLSNGAQTMFNSFWGQFGWMGVPMTSRIYMLLAAFTLIALIGAVLAFWRWRKLLSVPQHHAIVLFGLLIILAFGQVIAYNLKFVQFQGRYLFVALIPISMLISVGLVYWCSLLEHRISIARWASVGIAGLFAIADLYILFRIIIPQLT